MSEARPDEPLETIHKIAELRERYQMAALDPLLRACETFANDELLNVAIFGRFKAGKSSFLNHLIGLPLLPVGVIPVTTVITEIECGPHEKAEVAFKNRSAEQIPLARIGEFISEGENPENALQVDRVRVTLPSLKQYRGIRFVDTPGLESVLEHNTGASLDWLPKAGLALVAVGVDPPLSQHDIDLIRGLSSFTPNISVLLTKVDVLSGAERRQVQGFVEKQLARYWDRSIPVFPYSIRPGFEHLRADVESKLLTGAREDTGERRAAILRHKLDSLIAECHGYLTLALKASETDDSQRKLLLAKITGEKTQIEDTRQALRLSARHAAATSRPALEGLLRPYEAIVQRRLLVALKREFSSWTSSLAATMQRFEDWLSAALHAEMDALTAKHRDDFLQPAMRTSRLLWQSLQDFRNRLSERALEALGVPLPVDEMELSVQQPQSPDIRVGKIFDRSWELLSPILPMILIRPLVCAHFERKVPDVVEMNLSRLTSQWDEVVKTALGALEREAIHRLDSLVATIEKLTSAEAPRLSQIREDLAALDELR